MSWQTKAITAAIADTKDGFKYHCIRNAHSMRISTLTDAMSKAGEPKSYRDVIELVWENSLNKGKTS